MALIINPNKKRDIPIIKPVNRGLNNREFHAIQLCITTECNRNCTSCIFKMPHIIGSHVDVDWIKYISKYFQGLRLLQISGGEPTIHPEFQYITEHIREWFNPQMLMLITNGAKILKYKDILGYYDHIRITYYDENTYPGSTSNLKVINKFKEQFKGPSRIYNKLSKHRIGLNESKKYPCGLGANDLALIIHNKLYPCCSGAGVDKTRCVDINKDWRKNLKNLQLPCDKGCPFASTKELFTAWQNKLANKEPEKYKKLVEKFEKNELIEHKKIKDEGWDKWVDYWLNEND